MPIDVTCPSCSRNLYLRDELVGRQIRCPQCQNILTVPRPDYQPTLPEPMEPPPPPLDVVRRAPPCPAARPDDAYQDRLDEVLPAPPRPQPRRPPADDGTNKTGIGGGLALMLAGGLWAGFIIWNGGIPTYSVFMVIAGLVAVIRGLLKKSNNE